MGKLDLSKYKHIIFDLDGTLANRDTGELLEGVADYFDSLDSDMPLFSIATNQGGVGLRYWMKKEEFGEPEKYPTVKEAEAHVSNVISAIQGCADEIIYFYVYICFAYITQKGVLAPVPYACYLDDEWNPNFRKPSAGMLMRSIQKTEIFDKQTVLMVGDRPEDEEAAKRTGCDFMWAWEFFGREKPSDE